ncbi:hypothetical protein PROFUN_05066 [Planoprotostelium fungivorum]|uniref:Uncharacterized protein n=1 Tax=Planoprotostelium fungivorum TaxID=1890364 RepID=A0A2P6NSA6_9EUKA|nr:hypothetical protein PROFUN_05066 [Planoprotostelium fungivorum]
MTTCRPRRFAEGIVHKLGNHRLGFWTFVWLSENKKLRHYKRRVMYPGEGITHIHMEWESPRAVWWATFSKKGNVVTNFTITMTSAKPLWITRKYPYEAQIVLTPISHYLSISSLGTQIFQHSDMRHFEDAFQHQLDLFFSNLDLFGAVVFNAPTIYSFVAGIVPPHWLNDMWEKNREDACAIKEKKRRDRALRPPPQQLKMVFYGVGVDSRQLKPTVPSAMGSTSSKSGQLYISDLGPSGVSIHLFELKNAGDNVPSDPDIILLACHSSDDSSLDTAKRVLEHIRSQVNDPGRPLAVLAVQREAVAKRRSILGFRGNSRETEGAGYSKSRMFAKSMGALCLNTSTVYYKSKEMRMIFRRALNKGQGPNVTP